LLELLMAMVIFAGIAVGMMICFSRAATSDIVSKENVKAHVAAVRVMDAVRTYALTSFSTTYAYYNSNPADDPNGSGTAPGSAVTLSAQDSPGGTATVTIQFPETSGHLREDVTSTDWAMPRDLNGDDAVGSAAVDGSYKLLPVKVTVTWQGARGQRTYSLVTIITAKRLS